jgi:hypothetical protein
MGVGVHKSTSFCHRNHFFVFRNEHAQSTTLGPKLMFGVVSRNFVVARHPFRKRVSGCIQSTSFCHRNNFVVFFHKETCPLNYFSSKTHVGWFRAIPLPHVTHSKNGCRVHTCDTQGVYFALCREIYPNLGCSVKISFSRSHMSLIIQTIRTHFTEFRVIQSHRRPKLEPVKNFYSRRECKLDNQSRFINRI